MRHTVDTAHRSAAQSALVQGSHHIVHEFPPMRVLSVLLFAALVAIAVPAAARAGDSPAKLKVLIIDGQNNHNWQQTTPVLKKILEDSGRFTVDVATSPR